MSSNVSDQDLGDAFLQSVQRGSFPQSEDVASASVSSDALPKLLEVISRAKEDTKNEIRQLSREAAPDVDGWISQARKLQDDIKRSQATAKEIVEQAELGKEKTAVLQDAATNVSFLYSEIGYNESLVRLMEQLQDIATLLESAQDAAVHSHILYALERLEDADGAFKRLGPFQSTRAAGLLKARSADLKSAIVENVTEAWNGLITVDTVAKRVSLKAEIERDTTIHIDTIVDALTKLDLLETFTTRLARELDTAILSPRLFIDSEHIVSAIEIERDEVSVKGTVSDMGVKAALEDVEAVCEYISTRLPPTIAVPLSEKLVPMLASRLINKWLLPAVPLSTDGILEFQEILSLVLGLVEFFDELGWAGQKRLVDWVDQSAAIWLARQKETSIAQLQRIFPKNVQQKKTVERVETQILPQGDAMLGGREEHDKDWGADWGEEDAAAPEEVKPQAEDIEEEDVSAWGMDDDEPQEEEKEKEVNNTKETEDDADDWGADWDDEETSKPPAHSPDSTAKRSTTDGNTSKEPTVQRSNNSRELTLRETYTVTAIPDSIMEIILQVIADVEKLNSPSLVGTAIAPASGGLYAIPGLLLAMYRATAATHYSKHDAANMLIYNDCTRLSDRLTLFLAEQLAQEPSSTLPPPLRPSTRLKDSLEQNIKAIDRFGKRAYGREMESQRTIICDHLDAAQGFAGCTNMPFAAECDNAIMMTIDRIADVKMQWSPILSHSALLQSLGSLVNAALLKVITEIEDMSDIAEDESKKLYSYCTSLSTLSTHFQTPSASDAAAPQDMTSIYIPNWFRFQYLSEVLNSNLADIRYFWTDGGLNLEMKAEEVVDLIKALFAESEHRRKAIGVIRRGSVR